MTARSKRRQPAGDTFPGMPSLLPKKPPKAEADPEAMTLDEAIARSIAILDRVLAAFPVEAVIGLLSGGNDSVVVNHLFRRRVNAIAHVNTGTGIPETTQHVRDVVAAWGLPLHEMHPKHSYRDLVLGNVLSTRGKNIGWPVWKGFPGPAGHTVMYRRQLDEIEFFYPHAAKPLRELQREAQAAGLAACMWGKRPPGPRSQRRPAGRLCRKCDGIEGQADLLAEWRESGLITSDQFATFTRTDEQRAA
jgi:hypothetical protein